MYSGKSGKVLNKVRKVKRPVVNWFELLKFSGDLRFSYDYWTLKAKWPNMSDNRIAYNVLKKYYSTTSLHRVRWLGSSLLDEPEKVVKFRGTI